MVDKPYIIEAAAMRKIMEVEGITLTPEDLALLDEIATLPEAERLKRILAYVKKTTAK